MVDRHSSESVMPPADAPDTTPVDNPSLATLQMRRAVENAVAEMYHFENAYRLASREGDQANSAAREGLNELKLTVNAVQRQIFAIAAQRRNAKNPGYHQPELDFCEPDSI